MKVRKHDLNELIKLKPKILEFHFSDSDLNMELEGKFEQNLMVHCYEYFDRKLLDTVSLGETNQIHSQEKTIDLIQKAIDKTSLLGEVFNGKPSLIVHPGGYSINTLTELEVEKLKGRIINAVNKLNFKDVNFLLENMPPYAWFFGGRWQSNVFLSAADMINYCQETGNKVCYDICHGQLYCNKNNISIINELEKILDYVDHFHLSDADGEDEEGLQFGEGNMPFTEIIPILNKKTDISFAVEVWQGHLQGGKGFKEFLDKIKEAGLIIT